MVITGSREAAIEWSIVGGGQGPALVPVPSFWRRIVEEELQSVNRKRRLLGDGLQIESSDVANGKTCTGRDGVDIGKSLCYHDGPPSGLPQSHCHKQLVDKDVSSFAAVVGDGFLMRDITIENAAGPSKHQAVALRVGADLSAFYRCNFVGYQDTLYVHSLRQFYRECNVYGTVDFIFGNAAVVLQNCNLYARKPLPNQQNIFTAHGREDPNQNTGISIQRCKVAAAADLIPVQANFSTYLGRPWKEYLRTVFM
ncbi:hypothetical protein C4D60_Mb11t13800 [Musa balbisiana]|uniref:Pectinesterase n=1 Tax=Musa balbisiana TaxID=52838 RepID=A0A4S8J3Y0_MUSBA|nr:hypothetical protein C4D60_Mb11t13800 [Musa balbisiana]